MQDRHVQELCAALKSIAGAISYLAFAIIMSSALYMCSSIGHH